MRCSNRCNVLSVLVVQCILLIILAFTARPACAALSVSVEPQTRGLLATLMDCNIVISFGSDAEIDLNKILVKLNGQDVTDDVRSLGVSNLDESRKNLIITYPVHASYFRQGEYTFEVSVGDQPPERTVLNIQNYEGKALCVNCDNTLRGMSETDVNSVIEEQTRLIKQKDTKEPQIKSFKVKQDNIDPGQSVEIVFKVTDDLGLKQVELWRSSNKKDWVNINQKDLSGEISASGIFTDKPSLSGNWYYRVHVVDKAGNRDDEEDAEKVTIGAELERDELLRATKCPSGNGLYCGESGLDQNKKYLYKCKNGKYERVEKCSNGCKRNAAGKNDECNASAAKKCPSGNGLYCGDSDLDQNKNYLYKCTNGTYALQTKCSNGCKTNAAGKDDECKATSTPTPAPAKCPSGNGLYCGDSGKGQNTNYLYQCTDGAYSLKTSCSNGCQQNVAGKNDECKAASTPAPAPAKCQSGNGLYCGDSGKGQNTGYLYQCTDGVYSLKTSCSNGCQQNAVGKNDACKAASTPKPAPAPAKCPSGNGLYCGDAGKGQNTGHLYKCTDGTYSLKTVCSKGCQQNGAGKDDSCKTTTTDKVKPVVNSFRTDRERLSVNETVTFSYAVSDAGGLKQVELWRTNNNSVWAEVPNTRQYLNGKAQASGSLTDSPSTPGIYYYGLHVVDIAGNWDSEGGAKKVTVTPHDNQKPLIIYFGPNRPKIEYGETVDISYDVSDKSGFGLKQVELWRGTDKNNLARLPDKDKTHTLNKAPRYAGKFTDRPPSAGTYYYGIHVLDHQDNVTVDDGAKPVVVRPPDDKSVKNARILEIAQSYCGKSSGRSQDKKPWFTDCYGGDGQRIIDAFAIYSKTGDYSKIKRKLAETYKVDAEAEMLARRIESIYDKTLKIPKECQEVLDMLDVQKQCFEWVNSVALDASAENNTVGTNGYCQDKRDCRVKIKEILPGNGLYMKDGSHSMIVLRAEHSRDSVIITVAESNYETKWHNPPGAIPWERKVSCIRPITIKYTKDEFIGIDTKQNKKGIYPEYIAVDYSK